MKVVIFAGGRGTRISEESYLKPKPMVEIGGKPMLWHIMKIYASYGFNEFVICLGYKGHVIKEYFMNYFMYNSDITIDLTSNQTVVHNSKAEQFKITLVDTGLETMTAGRLQRVKQYVGNETFMLTYGDGVADIDLNALLAFHKTQGTTATISAIQPGSRFGIMELNAENKVYAFKEKPTDDGVWINGGFFVLEPNIFDILNYPADDMMWERKPLEDLSRQGQLSAFKHNGFWKSMDTLRDSVELNELWEKPSPPWKVWND